MYKEVESLSSKKRDGKKSENPVETTTLPKEVIEWFAAHGRKGAEKRFQGLNKEQIKELNSKAAKARWEKTPKKKKP